MRDILDPSATERSTAKGSKDLTETEEMRAAEVDAKKDVRESDI